jgi:hypothetical protein
LILHTFFWVTRRAEQNVNMAERKLFLEKCAFTLEVWFDCTYILYIGKQERILAMATLNGYIARETEAAVAFVTLPLAGEHKPLWIPRKKISQMVELDTYSPTVQLAGERIRRFAFPVELEVDSEWLAKVQ